MNELIRMENQMPLLSAEIAQQIVEIERQAKLIEEKQKSLKKAILDEMEAKGIIKVETDDLAITYVQPTDREDFDKKQFRSDNPDLYDEYIRMTPVKASIRIKVK